MWSWDEGGSWRAGAALVGDWLQQADGKMGREKLEDENPKTEI